MSDEEDVLVVPPSPPIFSQNAPHFGHGNNLPAFPSLHPEELDLNDAGRQRMRTVLNNLVHNFYRDQSAQEAHLGTESGNESDVVEVDSDTGSGQTISSSDEEGVEIVEDHIRISSAPGSPVSPHQTRPINRQDDVRHQAYVPNTNASLPTDLPERDRRINRQSSHEPVAGPSAEAQSQEAPAESRTDGHSPHSESDENLSSNQQIIRTGTDATNQAISGEHVPPAGSNVERHNAAESANRDNTRLVIPETTRAPTSVIQPITPAQDSPADFRATKRRRVESTEVKEQENQGNEEDDGDDANCCPICFEDWTTSGLHRLVCLRCGHLFGQSCIEKWLKGQTGKCPQCNAKAKRQDIRVLYTKVIKAVDTSERDRALDDLRKERELRRGVELEAAQSRLQAQLVKEESNRLKAKVERLQQNLQSLRNSTSSAFIPVGSQSGSSSKPGQGRLNGQFILDRTVKIWEGGNCRVMANSPSLATLVVSQPSSSPLFPGFGIKKISTIDMKTSQFLTLHNKAIRDISFHPVVEDGLLLSVSLDKTIKMTSMLSNAQVQVYNADTAVWSCVWNTDDRNYFYAGLMNGTVVEYDIRNTSESLQHINAGDNRSPVVSLQYVSRDPQAIFRHAGLLVGQLSRVSFYEKKDNEYKLHLLPLEGNLSSLCFEPSTRNLLASFKPTSKHATTRHMMCEMTSTSVSADPNITDVNCSVNVIQTFHGGRSQTMLSKSLLMLHPCDQSRLMVCASEEASRSMHIWDCGTGEMTQGILTDGVVVDICAINSNQKCYLAALTEKNLRLHRWNEYTR